MMGPEAHAARSRSCARRLAELRKASLLMIAELADRLRCVACAIEGKGSYVDAR
jgi:hypothetical protein